MDPYSQMRDVHSLYPWRMHTPVIRVPFTTSQTPVWTPQTGVSAHTLRTAIPGLRDDVLLLCPDWLTPVRPKQQ